MLQKNQIIKEAKYLLEKNATIREVANQFSRSKSSVHKDLTISLVNIDSNLSKSVQKLLKTHLLERHIRGGEATKMKYKN